MSGHIYCFRRRRKIFPMSGHTVRSRLNGIPFWERVSKIDDQIPISMNSHFFAKKLANFFQTPNFTRFPFSFNISSAVPTEQSHFTRFATRHLCFATLLVSRLTVPKTFHLKMCIFEFWSKSRIFFQCRKNKSPHRNRNPLFSDPATPIYPQMIEYQASGLSLGPLTSCVLLRRKRTKIWLWEQWLLLT